MQPGQPSRTAQGAAAHRAAHQILEQGRIFRDPLALKILGADADQLVHEAENDPTRRALRLFIAIRSRFAEDAVTAAAARGLRQVVVLGAGLDTYAYRADVTQPLRIFEVDHPATQAWKRARLAETGIPLPDALTFAPVDFERETLADGLAAAGFDVAQQTFFTWLGVAPYLTERTVYSTLDFVAKVPGGAHVVFDYANPPDSISESEGRAAHLALAERVARAGESFRSYLETDTLRAELTRLGFCEIEDLGPTEIRARYFPGRGPVLGNRGGHIVRATTVKL